MRAEARYDGKWVVRTSLDLPAEEVALKYKQMWMVEDMMRSIKSVLQTRPVFHRTDEAIRGHVFCSFLALILRKELQDRQEKAGRCLHWDDVIRDLDRLEKIEVESNGKRLLLPPTPAATAESCARQLASPHKCKLNGFSQGSGGMLQARSPNNRKFFLMPSHSRGRPSPASDRQS